MGIEALIEQQIRAGIKNIQIPKDTYLVDTGIVIDDFAAANGVTIDFQGSTIIRGSLASTTELLRIGPSTDSLSNSNLEALASSAVDVGAIQDDERDTTTITLSTGTSVTKGKQLLIGKSVVNSGSMGETDKDCIAEIIDSDTDSGGGSTTSVTFVPAERYMSGGDDGLLASYPDGARFLVMPENGIGIGITLKNAIFDGYVGGTTDNFAAVLLGIMLVDYVTLEGIHFQGFDDSGLRLEVCRNVRVLRCSASGANTPSGKNAYAFEPIRCANVYYESCVCTGAIRRGCGTYYGTVEKVENGSLYNSCKDYAHNVGHGQLEKWLRSENVVSKGERGGIQIGNSSWTGGPRFVEIVNCHCDEDIQINQGCDEIFVDESTSCPSVGFVVLSTDPDAKPTPVGQGTCDIRCKTGHVACAQDRTVVGPIYIAMNMDTELQSPPNSNSGLILASANAGGCKFILSGILKHRHPSGPPIITGSVGTAVGSNIVLLLMNVDIRDYTDTRPLGVDARGTGTVTTVYGSGSYQTKATNSPAFGGATNGGMYTSSSNDFTVFVNSAP